MLETITTFIERHAFLLGIFTVVSLIGAKVDANVFTVQWAIQANRKGAANALREFQIALWFVFVMIVCAVAPDPEQQGWTVYQSIGMYSLTWASAVSSYTAIAIVNRRFKWNLRWRTFGDTDYPPKK